MIREVCRPKPRLLVGAHQGALMVLMCSLPFVVEVALRQHVSTETELIEARNTWGAIEGFVSIEPFSQAQYLDCNVLAEALPEASAPQCLVAPASAHKKTVAFWDGLTEHLGLNRVLSLVEGASAYPKGA